MERSRVVLVTLLLAAASVATATAAPRPEEPNARVLTTSVEEYCSDSEEVAFLQIINDYRAQNGLGPLTLTQTLGAAADHHSTDMAVNNYFSHTLSDGTTWSQNMRNHGYTSGGFIGENIAAGFASAASVFNAWKGSSGHNANMLGPNYTAIGIGRDSGYWTTDFGSAVDGVAVVCGAEPAPAPTSIPEPTVTPDSPNDKPGHGNGGGSGKGKGPKK